MDQVELKKYVEYAFYNPNTDRVVSAVFGKYLSFFFVESDHLSYYTVTDKHGTEKPTVFTGKHGYILLGEV